MVGCGFALHTYEYNLTENENGLTIAVRYGLNDGKAVVTPYIEKLTYYTVHRVQIVGSIPCGTPTV